MPLALFLFLQIALALGGSLWFHMKILKSTTIAVPMTYNKSNI